MNQSPGVFSEGEGEVVIGRNSATKQPIIMYSPIEVCKKFEEAARDNRKGKLAMQSAKHVESLTATLNTMGEKVAFLEEQLAKVAEKGEIRKQMEAGKR